MMHEIRSFSIMQTAKVMGVIYFILSVIPEVIFSIGAIFRGHFERAIGFLIFGPPIYAILGFTLSVIAMFIYNEVSDRMGGIQFDIVPKG